MAAKDGLETLREEIRATAARYEDDHDAIREALATLLENARQAGPRAGNGQSPAPQAPAREAPSLLAFWGPAVTTAAILGGLGSWVVEKTVTPIEESLHMLREADIAMQARIDRETRERVEIDEKDAEERGYLRGRQDMVLEQLHLLENRH